MTNLPNCKLCGSEPEELDNSYGDKYYRCSRDKDDGCGMCGAYLSPEEWRKINGVIDNDMAESKSLLAAHMHGDEVARDEIKRLNELNDALIKINKSYLEKIKNET